MFDFITFFYHVWYNSSVEILCCLDIYKHTYYCWIIACAYDCSKCRKKWGRKDADNFCRYHASKEGKNCLVNLENIKTSIKTLNL